MTPDIFHQPAVPRIWWARIACFVAIILALTAFLVVVNGGSLFVGILLFSLAIPLYVGFWMGAMALDPAKEAP